MILKQEETDIWVFTEIDFTTLTFEYLSGDINFSENVHHLKSISPSWGGVSDFRAATNNISTNLRREIK